MTVEFRKEGHTAWIGLNRPEAKNALDAGTLRELDGVWKTVATDADIRAAIIYSALPDIFCAGMDLKSVIPILTRSREPVTEDEKWLSDNVASVFTSMLRQRDWDKPIISAVHGLCLTGGFEMVQGTDLRVASTDALFQMREATFGIMPIGGSNVFLPRQIPLAAAKEILCMGQNIAAQRLYDWGFLNRVTEKEKLLDVAGEMAERICSNGPLAVQGVLKCIRTSLDLDTDKAMAIEMEIGLPIFGSADAREGVKAFKEKRKADFKGE